METIRKLLVRPEFTMGLPTVIPALRYRMGLFVRNRRFKRRPPHGEFQALGRVLTVKRQPGGAWLHAQQGHIEIRFWASGIVRLRASQDGVAELPLSYAVVEPDETPAEVTYEDTPQALTIRTDQLTCEVDKAACTLVIKTRDGRLIVEDTTGFRLRGEQVMWSSRLPDGDGCYGLGERASGVNLRGRRYGFWNSDLVRYRYGSDPLYLSIPFLLGLRPDLAYGVLWDNPSRGWVDLGEATPGEKTFFAESGEACVYLMAGHDPQAVLSAYTALTGHMPLPPLWALGFHQSRWGYDEEATFRTLAHQFRQRRLPCDALYFDIDYMDGYRVFTWNRERFPQMPALLKDLRAQGFKPVAIIDPGIKIDRKYDVYLDGVQRDVFLKYPDGTRVAAPVWPGRCHFPDFSRPHARAWWAEQVGKLVQAGFAGLWNDMNEPALINLSSDKSLPPYVMHEWEEHPRSHLAGGHNTYGMLMARSTYEGLRQHRPDARPFVMTRAAYAGAQRYTSSWTGDNTATWEHLRLSISMALNMGLSGLPFTGPDTGGFHDEPSQELFARWMQVSSLLPYFRVHTIAGSRDQEPWSFGEQVESISRCALERRYRLLPMLYTAFAQNAQHGTPIIRPLFWLEPRNKALYDVDDAFMVGDALLAAPVLDEGATRREVTLPAGTWYAFESGEMQRGGGRITADAPLDTLPLFARAGSVIPLWPVMQYVGELPVEELLLRVFAGTGESVLYEDAGEGMAYRDGETRWSTFTTSFRPSGEFVIEWHRSGAYQPSYERVRVEVVGISGEPERVELDGGMAPVWYFNEGVVEFVAGPFERARIIGREALTPFLDETRLHPPH
ncbi:glycoside hydrolase family 31 protein [Aggregatilinea lenta]|uniref:glycoside hydrolase family 31 protein n=1 Tax=Aggregatilinea lenta TaxID=913108 RepID=UPI000E5A8778|nr:glycoside hydrolase family 31 protein [Aggregatilinea lenta]